MATVEHPHVVRVYAFGDAGTSNSPRPYLAMEYVEGENLDEKIRREGGLGTVEALRITKEAVQALRAALEAAHRASRHEAGQYPA